MKTVLSIIFLYLAVSGISTCQLKVGDDNDIVEKTELIFNHWHGYSKEPYKN